MFCEPLCGSCGMYDESYGCIIRSIAESLRQIAENTKPVELTKIRTAEPVAMDEAIKNLTEVAKEMAKRIKS